MAEDNRQGRFMVCEGLDASGKTTSLESLITHLENVGMKVIYSKGLKSGTFMGRISSRYPCTLTLLLEQLYIDYFHNRPLLKKGYTILQDRWYYSVLSHNTHNMADRLLGYIAKGILKEPDALFYMDVSHKERIKRLRERAQMKGTEEELEEYQDTEKIEGRISRLMAFYERFKGKKAIVDTTGNTPKESGRILYALYSVMYPHIGC